MHRQFSFTTVELYYYYYLYVVYLNNTGSVHKRKAGTPMTKWLQANPRPNDHFIAEVITVIIIIIIIKQTKISNNFLRKIKIDACENEPTKHNCYYCYGRTAKNNFQKKSSWNYSKFKNLMTL